MLHSVGGCPVPTRPVFVTTAVLHVYAIICVRRAEKNQRLLAFISCSNNQITAVCDLHPLRVVVELSFRRRFHPCDTESRFRAHEVSLR